MKVVHLIRHAKSGRDDPSLEDRDRPLAKRGTRDAHLMGTRMQKAGLGFDVLYSSPALRAVETARLLMEAMDVPSRLLAVVDDLYDAGKQELVEFLRSRPATLKSIALMLHNPTVTALANSIGDLKVDNIPTCGVYSVSFDISHWSGIGSQPGRTIRFDCPRMSG